MTFLIKFILDFYYRIKFKNSTIDLNFKYKEPVNIFNSKIGKNVFIGPFCEIGKSQIGDNSRISSHSFLCEGVSIGSDCFIGHGVTFINDKFDNGKRAYGNKDKYKKTLIENSVLIGSNSTILPVNIVSGSVIAAGSVVTKNIEIKGVYAGNPAILIKKLN